MDRSRRCHRGNDASAQREGEVLMQKFRYIVHAAGSGLLAATMLAAAMPVVAQDASPAAGATGAGCTVEPRDVEELIGFYFGPEGTPLPTPTAATVASEAE